MSIKMKYNDLPNYVKYVILKIRKSYNFDLLTDDRSIERWIGDIIYFGNERKIIINEEKLRQDFMPFIFGAIDENLEN